MRDSLQVVDVVLQIEERLGDQVFDIARRSARCCEDQVRKSWESQERITSVPLALRTIFEDAMVSRGGWSTCTLSPTQGSVCSACTFLQKCSRYIVLAMCNHSHLLASFETAESHSRVHADETTGASSPCVIVGAGVNVQADCDEGDILGASSRSASKLRMQVSF